MGPTPRGGAGARGLWEPGWRAAGSRGRSTCGAAPGWPRLTAGGGGRTPGPPLPSQGPGGSRGAGARRAAPSGGAGARGLWGAGACAARRVLGVAGGGRRRSAAE